MDVCQLTLGLVLAIAAWFFKTTFVMANRVTVLEFKTGVRKKEDS